MRLFFCLVILSLSLPSWAKPNFFSREEARQLAELVSLPGLEQFISDQAEVLFIQKLGNKMVEWTAEGIHQTLHSDKQTTPTPKELKALLFKDPLTSKKLQKFLQKKLEEWLPKQVGKILYDEILKKQIVGEAHWEEFKEIEGMVETEIGRSLNEQADRWIGGWYDKLMSHSLHQATFWLSQQMGSRFGTSVHQGLQKGILKGLSRELPREALSFLQEGPAAFEKYVDQFQSELPSEIFRQARNKLMRLHIVNLPNPVYGGILAASASLHLVKAFAGAKVNLYELKRAKEVTETMIWQLRNREYISLNLGDFVDLIQHLENQLGSFHWKHFSKIRQWGPAHQFLKKLDWIEKELKKLEATFDQATGEILKPFKDLLKTITDEFQGLSKEMLQPLIDLPCLTPESCPTLFEGVPDITTWEGLKKMLGREEGLLGKLGEKSPLDYLENFYEDSGMKEDLEKLNRDVAKGISKAAVAVTNVLHITGPLARILEVEKIPPKNPSNKSDFDPVYLHNGEFYLAAVDVTIPGEGLDFQFKRIYRSASDFLGVLGYNWTHNFASRLHPWESPEGPGLTYIDPEGKKYFFKQEGEEFVAPIDLPLSLKNKGGRYEMHYPDGSIYSFDHQGWLQRIEDAVGHQLSCIYNDQEQLTHVQDSLGRSIRFEYSPNGLLKKMEDFGGRQWRFDYNDQAELIAAISPGTPTFPKGKATRYRYQDHKLILAIDPKGQVFLQNHYDREGRIAKQVLGEDLFSVEARYEGLNTWVKDRGDQFHLYEHDPEGHLVRHFIVTQHGIKMGGEYSNTLPSPVGLTSDCAAPSLCLEEIGITPLSGLSLGAPHSLWGGPQSLLVPRPAHLLNPPIRWAGLRSRSLTQPREGNPVNLPQFQCDIWGNVLSMTTEKGVRQFEVDATNLITKEITETGEERHYSYDANDNLTRIEVPAQKLKVEFEYNVLNRVIIKEDFLNGKEIATTHFEYDPFNRLVQTRLPNDTAIQYHYDPAGRLSARRASDIQQFFEYDPEGRLIKAREGEITVALAYDEHNQIVGEAIQNQWTWKKEDKKNNLLVLHYPSGFQVLQQYDGAGKLLEVFAEGIPIPLLQDGIDQGKEITPPNGSFVYDYDSLQRLVQVREESQQPLFQYQYDPFGRLVLVKDLRQNKEIRYFYNGWQRVESQTSDGSLHSYVYGSGLDQILARVDNKGKPVFGPPDLSESDRFLSEVLIDDPETSRYSPTLWRKDSSWLPNLNLKGISHRR